MAEKKSFEQWKQMKLNSSASQSRFNQPIDASKDGTTPCMLIIILISYYFISFF